MKTIALKASHVDKWFGDGSTRTAAVNDVSFEAYAGEMMYIIGPSGSGKTTLLSIISGILKPNHGDVVIDDRSIWTLSENELADFRLNRIGFVFQDFHLFPRLSTLENVAIPLLLRGMDWKAALNEARQYLEIVELSSRAELPPVRLSGGEQQRVAIARAIAGQPDLLVLDEPTASLDGETGRRIVDFVKTHILNENRCIIIVTHDNRIYEYADAIMKMEDGRVIDIERTPL